MKGKNIAVGIEIGKAKVIKGKISLKTNPREVKVNMGGKLDFILPWEYYEVGGQKSEWQFSLELLDYRGDVVGSIYEVKKDKYAQPDKDEGEFKLSVRAPNREGEYKYTCRIRCKLVKAMNWDSYLTPPKNSGEVGKLIDTKKEELEEPVKEEKKRVGIQVITEK